MAKSLRSVVSGADVPDTEFVAVQILEVELSEALPTIVGEPTTERPPYRHARVLVRLHHHPVGLLEMDLGGGPVTPDALERQIWAALGSPILAHLEKDGLLRGDTTDHPPFPLDSHCPQRQGLPQWRPLTSVIICTLGRPRQLQNALDALLALDYPDVEIIVVDNGPQDPSTADLIHTHYADRPNLRYETESLRGLSAARNRGIGVARGEVIAFTDDDIVVDRHWLSALVDGFDPAGTIACVTGLTLASELESPAQYLFETYGAFNKGYEPMLFSRDRNPANTILYPYSAGVFGGGGNSAFRVTCFPEVLRFDRRLGPGSMAFGAEDLDVFLRTILGGKSIRYAPDAIAWHEHRRSHQELRWQLFTYGAGFTALLTKWLLRDYRVSLKLALLAPKVIVSSLRTGNNAESGSHRLSKELRRLELLGFLYGPIAYARSALKTRRGAMGPGS